MRIGKLLLSVLFLISLDVQQVIAEEKELSLKQMLLTPGELTQGHAEIENKCNDCHVHFDKSNQTPLCLDCHTEINEDLLARRSFHGILPTHQTEDCKSCHTDHKGRDFDITGLDQDNFDHSQTNFKLDGRHKNLRCSGCHTNLNSKPTNSTLAKGILDLPVAKGYRFEKFECGSCHQDFHKEALGDDCESCHSPKSWTDSQFEHDKTDFPLDGKHFELECDNCHINGQFDKIETQCQSCHLAKEPHLGVFGSKCIDCHTTKEWPNESYDHFKETGYELKDSHLSVKGVQVKCIDCHSDQLNPDTKCTGCHTDDDIHQGSNGDSCSDCHNQKSWDKTDFVHDFATTGFVLTGEHKKVSCDSCHTPGEERIQLGVVSDLGLIRNCIDCHQAIDPHYSKLGKDCGNCHQTEGWKESIRFNHDFTDFPLNASHQLLVCDSCHISSEFSNQSQKCVSCHKKDDIHQNTLGGTCESCHDTSVWSHWEFDHQVQTEYLLEGSHQNLECNLCHSNQLPDPLKPDQQCISCHRDDDIHSGGFGVECQECHSQSNFEELSF